MSIASDIMEGLNDAISFAQGDRSRGRFIVFVQPSHPYWRLPDAQRENLRKAIGADEVREERPIPVPGSL